MSKPLAVATLVSIAASLLSDDGENVEYDRALAELVTVASGLSMDEVPRITNMLRREDTMNNRPKDRSGA